jgi:putative acetyltransferase
VVGIRGVATLRNAPAVAAVVPRRPDHRAFVNSRRATLSDAEALHALRRDSILELAPSGMSMDQARAWAAKGDLESMTRRLQDTEIWLAEIDAVIAGWVAVRGDYLDALYVHPAHARRGIGTNLLKLVEDLLRARGVRTIRADVSWNAEGFYLRHGYEPVGARPPNEPWPMRKVLVIDAAAIHLSVGLR